MSSSEARQQRDLIAYARRMQRHTESLIRFPVGTVIGQLEVVGHVEPCLGNLSGHGAILFRGQNGYGPYTRPFADYIVLDESGLEQIRTKGYVYDHSAIQTFKSKEGQGR